MTCRSLLVLVDLQKTEDRGCRRLKTEVAETEDRLQETEDRGCRRLKTEDRGCR